MKTFNIQNNIGKAKYVVNFHDGVKRHKDGSNFFDVVIFRNKKSLTAYLSQLKKEGYAES